MPTYTTWNPADKAAGLTLSNGNLTASSPSQTYKQVRATQGFSSGKWYWEVTLNANDIYGAYGISTTAESVDYLLGQTLYGYGYTCDSNLFHNNGWTVWGSTCGNGDVVGVAVDMDAGKIWFSKNGTWLGSGDPATGTNPAFTGISGTFYPAGAISAAGAQSTANFGASSFAYSVPSGFNAGVYTGQSNVTVTPPAASLTFTPHVTGPLSLSVPAVALVASPLPPSFLRARIIPCGFTDFTAVLRNLTAIEKSSFNEGGGEIAFDWISDTGEYHIAAPSWRADLPATLITSYAVMRSKLVCQQATTITVWVKTASKATRLVDDMECGGCLIAMIGDSNNNQVDRLAFGGWNDWTGYDLHITDPGEYSLIVAYADFPILALGITEWPAPPEGETATDQAWVDEVIADPPMRRQQGIVLTPYALGNPEIARIPAADIEILTGTPAYFVGQIISLPSADMVHQAYDPNFLAKLIPGNQSVRTHITAYENIGDPDTTRQWEDAGVGTFFGVAPGWILPPLPAYSCLSIMQFEADFPVAGRLSLAIYQISAFWGDQESNPLNWVQIGCLDGTDAFIPIVELDKYQIPNFEYGPFKWKILQFEIPASATTVRFQVRVTHRWVEMGQSSVYLSDIFAEYSQPMTGYPVNLSLSPKTPLSTWQIPINEQVGAQIIYECTLTGAEDGLTDIVLPISSLQARQAVSTRSYLSVVVSDLSTYSAAIIARQKGTIIVKRGYRLRDGRKVLQEIARSNFNDLRLDYGSRSQSLTLSGTRTRPPNAGTTRALQSASYKSVDSAGKRRFRVAVDHFFSPGDTAVVDGESLIVNEISYTISPSYEVMELAEA